MSRALVAVVASMGLLMTCLAVAEEPRLVADIEPAVLSNVGLSPTSITGVGERVFFSGRRTDLGHEFWTVDPEFDGADVRDILAGWNSSQPRELVDFNGTLLFAASDGIHGPGFWAADENGSWIVDDTKGRFDGLSIRNLTVAGDLAFFFSDAEALGYQLWVTDGTAEGVRRVTETVSTRYPDWLVVADGIAYFSGYDLDHGQELWRSDGTESGTWMVKDIVPGIDGSTPGHFSIVDEIVFFSADEPGVTGRELWRSDGSEKGTRIVRDIRPGPGGSLPWILTPSCSKLFFRADDGVIGSELWISDGSELGTRPVADIVPGPAGIEFYNMIAHDCGVAFPMSLPSTGQELWFSDGTELGTSLVKDINPGPADANINHFTSMGAKLFFNADDGAFGSELWSSDMTEPGTTMVTDFNPGPIGSSPSWLVTIKDEVWYSASVGTTGPELCRSDGTESGTRLVHDSVHPFSSIPYSCMGRGGSVFCPATTQAEGAELWVSDGSTMGTRLTRDINPGPEDSDPYLIAMLGERVLFGAKDSSERVGLWISDGTDPGTVKLADVIPGRGAESAIEIADTVFFIGYHETLGSGLWRTDGTVDGTELVKATTGIGSDLAAIGSTLYFGAHEPATGSELWRSDGTTAGTTIVADAVPGPDGLGPEQLTAVESTLYFTGSTAQGFPGGVNKELWRSDGTATGTVMVKEFPPYWVGTSPGQLTAHDGRLFFAADDGIHGFELWVSDGTEPGTTIVADINPDSPPYTQHPSSLVSFGTRLAFWHSDGIHGHELWLTDGTADGTKMVIDLIPGAAGSRYASEDSSAVVSGNRIWYPAAVPGFGEELVVSDGTPAGTIAFDLVPGKNSGDPWGITLTGDRLFFAAMDLTHGRELWAVDLDLFADGFESGETSEWSGVVP